ncbi:hypothetical protein [Salinarimonas soli]|uniref:Uncharacterized protein n=1 Tax=Salinarimonas soli TaxID=1638099 RepID=A0A5B2V9D4_9HYPH|nr:hypothetical protein [Salinarimonas soli]KAA2234949.1 hypothetical protein F0L46_21645 [Salinarimonas soli]
MSARIVLCGGLLLGLAACVDHTSSYLERRDTILPGAGDAARANAAIHTIDPWPRASADIVLTYDGERAARAVERYRTRPLDGEIAERTPPTIQLPVAR